MNSKKRVTIIVPVYGDWNSLSKCIKSLKKYVNTDRNKVIFVNDNGPDANKIEKKILRKIKGRKNLHYYRNPENIGFVKTCNRAVFELDNKKKNDVLILNSDTKVTKGFLDEMVNVLYDQDKIGAVCPRSNHATVFSVPINSDGRVSMRKSYSMYIKIKDKLPNKYISPVAHGFCLLIKRSVINRYGLFDEIYGKGYGEENDFCMRIRKKGYKCAVANYAYVFHFRARSFTVTKRNKLVEENEKILTSRYPDYYSLVNKYVDKVSETENKLLTSIAWSKLFTGRT